MGIIVCRRFPTYKDIPGELYHFPADRYLDRMRALQGVVTLVYEPKRGGSSETSATGGRSAFVGSTVVGDIYPDPEDLSHYFAKLDGYLEFAHPVRIAESGFSGKALQHAVHKISVEQGERVLQRTFAALAPLPNGTVQEGLVGDRISDEDFARPIREYLTRRPVRDVAFRYRVVDQVYRGRCALSGLALSNGNGRAETDAAHIRPVERGGPDCVPNGIALTKTLHWAFDRGLVSLADDGRILTVERGLDSGIRRLIVPDSLALLPRNPTERPHPAYLKWHRENQFKGVLSA